MTEEMRNARINQNLLKQEGTGWDVGYGILFLCSREARWITGLIMPIDGGTTAGKADRPALKADSLAEQMTGIPNKQSNGITAFEKPNGVNGHGHGYEEESDLRSMPVS
jgi:hypothetical protein